MKKLLLCLLTMLFAVSAQATAITWRTGMLYVPVPATPGDSTAPANSGTEIAPGAQYSATVYFFTSSTAASAHLLDPESTTPFYQQPSVAGQGYLNQNSPTVAHWLQAKTSDVFLEQTLYYAYVVITSPMTTNGDESGYWELISAISNVQTAAGNMNYNFRDNGSAFATQSWQWVPVPEPATMALVGIGIVALGLRRRRK